jgi:hypothetical protein
LAPLSSPKVNHDEGAIINRSILRYFRLKTYGQTIVGIGGPMPELQGVPLTHHTSYSV